MSQRNAARGILIAPERELLLMLMAFPWKRAPIWVAPGGGLCGDETWEHALRRELREETGYCTSHSAPRVSNANDSVDGDREGS